MSTTGAWFRIVRADAVAAGQMIGCEIGGQRIALYNVDGHFYATANICTHAFAILSDGWLDGDVVECPLHGGRFNVCSGKAQGDPVEQDLQVYPTRVEEGHIELFVSAEPDG